MARARPFIKLSDKRRKEIQNKPGGSNIGERTAADGPFAGTQPNSFPIKTIGDARSALKLAFNDPNPGKVRARVFARFPELRKRNERQDIDRGRPMTK